jgi:hypothetical protein
MCDWEGCTTGTIGLPNPKQRSIAKTSGFLHPYIYRYAARGFPRERFLALEGEGITWMGRPSRQGIALFSVRIEFWRSTPAGFRRHAPSPCLSALCGQRKVLRLFVSSLARRRQIRASHSLAKDQTLGISIDDCHFSGVCLLSDLIYRFAPSHSVLMILLTLFDVVVIFLTWLEYGKQRMRRQTESPRTTQS